MKASIITPEFHINGFSATHIIFDNSNFATIKAKCRIDNQLQHVHFILSFDKLNDIMRFSGENGEKILLSMVDEMMCKSDPPYTVVLKDVLGVECAFTSIRLKISSNFTQDMHTMQEANYFIVEEVWPINIIQQAKNLAQHTKDFSNINVVSKGVLQTSLGQLKNMYQFYLGLLELDIAENACRLKANLLDDRLFAMAKNSWEKY
jgi:hypothetical protein